MDPEKTPVAPSIKYLSQVLPEPGKEAKARGGRLDSLVNLVT